MSENEDIRQLLREGVEAARAGDKATARDRFERVTELDENNEQAWFRLAAVVESEEERRVCLENVLHINPDNERASQILDRMNAKQGIGTEDEVIPGVSRSQFRLIAGGGAAVVVVLILLVLVVVINNNNQQAAVQAATQVVLNNTATAVAQVASVGETQTAEATIATATRVSELPPENTPTNVPTATPTEERLPLPPAEVQGSIVAWGGRDVLSNEALEPRLYRLQDGGIFSVIGTSLGRDVRFTANSSRIVYTRYFPSTFDFGLEAINTNGTQAEFIQTISVAIKAEQPDACATANRIVFTGVPQETPIDLSFSAEPPRQVFIVDLEQAAADAEGTGGIIQITNDAATYSYPAFSPDCTRVAVVRDDVNSAEAGADVYLIDVATRTLSAVTQDLTTFTETTPRWSPDGTQVVFAAAPANDPENHDVVLVNADGTGVPSLLARTPADDILPVISPDGRYLAYSSNQEAVYNIYISPLFEEQVWQLTTDDDNVFVGGWTQAN